MLSAFLNILFAMTLGALWCLALGVIAIALERRFGK